MRTVLLFATAFALTGCGDLPWDSSNVQEQQIQRSFYSAGNPAPNNPPPDHQPKRESVPGEAVPDQ